MLEFIKENIELVITLIVIPTITWVFTKRHFQQRNLKKEDVAIEATVVKGMSDGIKLLNDMIDDIERRYEANIAKKDTQILKLETYILKLEEELYNLKNKI